jgi:hypothetical protein
MPDIKMETVVNEMEGTRTQQNICPSMLRSKAHVFQIRGLSYIVGLNV